MRIRSIGVLIVLFFCVQVINAQNSTVSINENNYKAYINSLPAFTMYGDNYFVTGTTLNNGSFSSQSSDVKYEIGFKQRLTNIDLPLDLFPFVTYRQKSFWNLYAESLPFREHNYNPSIGFAKLFVGENGLTDALWLAFEHESNGRDGEASRSWNFVSLSYLKPYGDDWQFRTKVWVPVGEKEGNEDITKYRGYVSLGATFNPIRSIFIDLDIQPALDNDTVKGFIKAGVSFKMSKNSNQFIYLQYFGGYAEDLINYNERDDYIRVGMAFKDLFANFRQH